ncbi:PilZ domain-containing protein [Sphingomonas sp. GC_Shp_3]|uniref:PilZ domain-containing protein n=1 Tax=Sphingomonas sp. GC_Shp_3 TaxID=2937383 RepID=UPI00226A4BB3|nr:PilZ domain-containing protein [Sphingomonas sp. GC_Shp_3]
MDQFSSEPLYEVALSDDAQDRSASRDSLFLMAELRVDEQVTTVRIRNLSAGGLMAEFPQGLDQDTEVTCELRGVGIVHGKVAWSAAGRVGIAFDRQINPLMARKPVGIAVKPKMVPNVAVPSRR